MKQLFDEVSVEVSKRMTRQYSTSFSWGILALHRHIRPAIYAIYGYVRLADEIVDSFHQYNRSALLDEFQQQTEEALANRIALNPVLHAFQNTVHQYAIDRDLIFDFLSSMRMDLSGEGYNRKQYERYIYGSAEVVGLMCLQVFTEGDRTQFERLKPYAMKLGSAFQKVNFLRDLKEDYTELGRTYFPDVDFAKFDIHTKRTIEAEIETEFYQALIGIQKLPVHAKFGVYLAYRYYWALFVKIKHTPVEAITTRRLRIPNSRKLTLAVQSYWQCKMAVFTK